MFPTKQVPLSRLRLRLKGNTIPVSSPIVAMLQKAADMANEDCKRAMDLAHKLSFQLRASEERLREAEAEAAHFRDRAARAEAWLVRIHNEVEQMFFPKKERDRHGVSRQ